MKNNNTIKKLTEKYHKLLNMNTDTMTDKELEKYHKKVTKVKEEIKKNYQ